MKIVEIVRRVLIVPAIVSLTACAFSNEGAVDFRRADPFRSSDGHDHLRKARKERQNITATKSAASSEQLPVHPVPLLHKDLPSGELQARIEPKDKISIRLRDGFLRNCNERRPSVMRGLKKNCEIAILLKTFEFTAGQDFNFKPGAEKDARLVYFSKDVQPGQFFNLHNLPVYGPIEYTGRPIGIDIWVLEIDAEDQQAVALLRTLASIGAKAYAPAAPVLAVLDQLGSALLSSGTDDVEFRYTMVLDPAGGYNGTVYSAAEAGDYVFIREDRRDTITDWRRLQLDHNTGRVWKHGEDGRLSHYNENTYLTVQVLRNAGSEDISLAQNTYGEFRAAIDKDATDKVANLKGFTEELQKLATKRVQIRNFNRAQKLYESMIARSDTSDTLALAKQDAYDLYQLLKSSAGKEDGDLARDQVSSLLSKLRALAKVDAETEIASFSNTENGFGKLEFKDFVSLVVDGPRARKATPSGK